MADTITVALSRPIKVKGAEVSELTFREPSLGDLVAGDIVGKSAGDVGRTGAVLASMAGVTWPEFKGISARDFAKINDNVAPLLGNGPEEDGTEQPSS